MKKGLFSRLKANKSALKIKIFRSNYINRGFAIHFFAPFFLFPPKADFK
jgi:hypothetical protein